MKKVFYLSLVLFLWLGFGGSAWASSLPISASAYCLIDRQTGQFLLGENENEERPMASTTKIMTALLTAEYADLQETAYVSQRADRTAEYTAGLKEGQELTVEEALKGALVKSYNDAAVVLAEHVAGDEAFFAQLMTLKAFALGAVHSNFQNASGLPDPQHYSTAYDLALLTRHVLENPIVAQIVSSPQVSFHHPGYMEEMVINNTNPLLNSYPGADGVKTGTTNAAGKCLIASATRDSGSFIAVALFAPDRAGDCRRLLDYGFSMTDSEILSTSEKMGTAQVQLDEEMQKEIHLLPGRNVSILTGEDEDFSIECRLDIGEPILAPIEAGEKVGQVQIWINQHYFDSVDARADQTVVQERWIDRGITWIMERIYRWLIHVW